MDQPVNDRRRFLQSTLAGSAAAVVGVSPATAPAAAAAAPADKPAPPPSPGYAYLNPEEAAFIEALVDHMVPEDRFSPKGTDLGLNTYIDRALAGSWGKGDRLYLGGPWRQGTPSQGYQLPLTPAELFRAGIAATNRLCVKTHGKPFDQLTAAQREALLVSFAENKVVFDAGPPPGTFFTALYQTVIEGMFSDPIYGGNRNKAGWKMVGFPGVIATHRENIVKYRDRQYDAEPLGIADVS
jgi:gluconate 2-dehydrogenase gamma chain